MNDAVGTELNIGDIVIFANSFLLDDTLQRGRIIEFSERYGNNIVKILDVKTNSNVERLPSSVISIMPIKAQHPENFI